MRVKRQYIVIAAGVVAASLVAVYLYRPSTAAAPVLQTPSAAFERTGPIGAYPDPTRTPGLINPDITQANIDQTICNPDWSTNHIRPPASYTTKLKKEQIQDWGLSGTPGDYEEDHLISLELGGNPTDPRNLWPEPYRPEPGAKEKDVVENYLHKQVCAARMTLHDAQEAIVMDWYKVYRQIHP
jgi:hypothetical protein